MVKVQNFFVPLHHRIRFYMSKTTRTYFIIFLSALMTLFGMQSCERLEIPEIVEDNDGEDKEEENPNLPEIGESETIRNGSRMAPYTVADVQTLGRTYEIQDAWVEGYIVGWVTGSAYPSGARFGAKSASATNILLADSIFEDDPVHCIPIQLPASILRLDLNLQNNPQNLRRHIKLKGDVTTYFKVVGLKKTSVYEWLGTSAMEDEKLALSITELTERFSNYEPGTLLKETDKWHTYSTSYTTDWKVGSYPDERFATICHTDTFKNHTFEYWLITPPINFNRLKKAVLTFDTMYDNWDGESELSVILMNEKEYDPENLLTILQARIASPELISENQWLPSGEITFNSFKGVSYLAFRYKGSYRGKRNTTFCIDNIKLQETEE